MVKASSTMNHWKSTNWLVILKMFQYVLSWLFVSVLNLHSTDSTWFGRSNKETRNGREKSEDQEPKSCGRSAPNKETGNGQSKGRERRVLSCHFVSQNLITHKVSDAVKLYAYLLGQTELFKHFVNIKVFHFIAGPHFNLLIQRARDPEYTAIMDAQPKPKPKGRGQKKLTYAICISIIYITNLWSL